MTKKEKDKLNKKTNMRDKISLYDYKPNQQDVLGTLGLEGDNDAVTRRDPTPNRFETFS